MYARVNFVSSAIPKVQFSYDSQVIEQDAFWSDNTKQHIPEI